MFDRPRGFSREAGEERLRQLQELAKDPEKRKEAWMGESAAEKPKPQTAENAPADEEKWDDPWAEFDAEEDKDKGQWTGKKAA